MIANLIPKFSLSLIGLFSFIVFSSLSAYWVKSPYDGWRIYEIIILIIINIISIYTLLKNPKSLFKSKNIYFFINFSLSLIFILICSSIYFSKYSSRALADASLYFLLFSYCFTAAILLKNIRHYAENLATWLAILPLLTLIFLPISLIDRLNGGIGVWTQSFTNIRMLDDALLPCLFFLWHQPAWLNPNKHKNQLKKSLLIIFIYVVSTFYLLSFLFQGARACLLAIAIGLFFIIFQDKKIKKLKLPLISLGLSIFIFTLYHYFISQSIGSSLVRYGSSGRTELWNKALKIWLDNKWLGVGGNNFFIQSPNLLPMHPHNIMIKFLSEWGVSLFILIILAIPFIFKVFQQYKKIPFFYISGTIAVLINSLLSGNMIYPASQLLSMTLIAYMFSYLPYTNQQSTSATKIIWIFLIIFFSISLIYIHFPDITCIDCISIDDQGAPGFWDSGRPLHLDHYHPEGLGQKNTNY